MEWRKNITVRIIRGQWIIANDFIYEGRFYKNKPSGQGFFTKNGKKCSGKFRQINLRKENPNEAIYKRKLDSDQSQIILNWE